MVATGLIAVGGALAWLSIAIMVALGIGRMIRNADRAELGEPPPVDTRPLPVP